MNDLILGDMCRCNNHRCAARAGCARYLQLEIDMRRDGMLWSPVNRFGDDTQDRACSLFIKASASCPHSCGPGDYCQDGKCERMGCRKSVIIE